MKWRSLRKSETIEFAFYKDLKKTINYQLQAFLISPVVKFWANTVVKVNFHCLKCF